MRTRGLDFDSLRYLSGAADRGNFSRAAAALGVKASTVSRRVASLEDELGLTLFERSHFGIRLTSSGKSVMVHVRRVLAELEAVKISAHGNASGQVGHIRLGIRMPPVGKPLQSLLEAWHIRYPRVDLLLHEINEREILAGIEERRLDAALVPKHALWPHVVAEPIYRERLLLAIPKSHALSSRRIAKWRQLRDQTFLVQGWDESQTAREFYSSFLGRGVNFQVHAASKQSVMALVGAGFGVTLVTESQAEVRFPGVLYRTIAEKNAWLEVVIIWSPANKEPVVGRFIAFLRDEARSRKLL